MPLWKNSVTELIALGVKYLGGQSLSSLEDLQNIVSCILWRIIKWFIDILILKDITVYIKKQTFTQTTAMHQCTEKGVKTKVQIGLLFSLTHGYSLTGLSLINNTPM